MRLVLDTNTVVSGLLWKGAEHGLLAEIGERADIALYASPKLLAELADVLSRQKLARADLVVSGDPHLLDLKSYRGIPIVGTREALERVAQSAKTGPV